MSLARRFLGIAMHGAIEWDSDRDDASRLSRRAFVQRSAVAAAAVGLSGNAILNAGEVTASAGIIDTHVYAGRWPFRRLQVESPAELATLLQSNQVSQAWAGTFEGLLHKDISAANQRLHEVCRREGKGVLVPFGAINPTLPDWEEDVRRCHEIWKMPGIRLHPNYHGYTLDDPRFVRVLALATERKLIVQLAAQLGDELPACLRLPSPRVDLRPLAAAIEPFGSLRLTVHNALVAEAERHGAMARMAQAYFDVGMIEMAEGMAALAKIARGRIVFGSCAPLQNVKTALHRSKTLTPADMDLTALHRENASQLIRGL